MTDFQAQIAAMTAEAAREIAALQAKFDAAPEIELVGLIDARGDGLCKTGQIPTWTWSFTFLAWRQPGGPLQSESVRLERQVTDEEKDRYWQSVHALQIVRVRAKLVPDPEQRLCGEILEVIEKDAPDTELAAIAAELQKPVTINDDVLGALTLDRRLNLFSGRADWNAVEVGVSLYAGDVEDADQILKIARQFWAEQKHWDTRLRQKAAERLLDLKNESWLNEDEDEVTADDFVQRLTPESAGFSEDGSFSFYYDDGDLFWGHVIIVSGTLQNGPTDAEIAG